MKILIAEDTEDARVMLEMALASQGHEVISSTNGVEALSQARKTPPDLIISDILMPEMDGFDLCRQVKADPELQKIPLIFYTATYTDHQDEALAISLGAARFVIKPQEPQVLMAIIQEVMAASQPEKIVVLPQPEKGEERLNEMHLDVLGRKLDKKIGELAQERDALKKSEEKYRNLVESVQDYYFFYTHDAEGVFTYLSPSVEIVLGYRPEEFLVHYSDYLTDNPANQEAERYSGLTLKGEEQPPYEIELYHKDNSIRWLEVKDIPILDQQGAVSHVEGIAHDITGRKRVDMERERLQRELQQAHKMEALGQLTSGVAHDFNNILGIIKGYTGMALKRYGAEAPGKMTGYLETVLKASDRGKDLVTQMLTFSRSDDSDAEPLLFAPLVKENIKMLDSILPSSVEIAFNYEEDLPKVLMDPTKLQQLLMNLAVNAKDAIKGAGSLAIDLRWHRAADAECSVCHKRVEGDWVELSVADSGSGMTPEVKGRIFEPFYTTKPVGRGTGMGLSVLRGIIRDYGGHLLLETEPGEGTVFRMLFPPVVEELPEAAETAQAAADLQQGGGGHVLVLDDEPELAAYIGELLEMYDYQTTIQTSSGEALSLFQEDPDKFALLITDQTMPELTGMELIEKIRQIRPDFPVILCTGYRGSVDEAEDTGIHHIGKPIDADRLIQLAGELLLRL